MNTFLRALSLSMEIEVYIIPCQEDGADSRFQEENSRDLIPVWMMRPF